MVDRRKEDNGAKKKMATVVQTMKYDDGSTFQGEIIEGKREGYGVQVWADGTKYTVGNSLRM